MNDRLDELRQQYGCGPVQFSGADEALYNRHLLFDDVIDPFKATPREQFEAMARSLRDVISQRWLLTEKTYEQKNPKRVYYLSLEFLIGRLLYDSLSNLGLLDVAREALTELGVDLERIPEGHDFPGEQTAGHPVHQARGQQAGQDGAERRLRHRHLQPDGLAQIVTLDQT